jgi:hypothetical protein
MRNEEPNPASAKEQAEGSRENVNVEGAPAKRSADGAKSKKELDGKNDSGPEPEVHGREIPPQNSR